MRPSQPVPAARSPRIRHARRARDLAWGASCLLALTLGACGQGPADAVKPSAEASALGAVGVGTATPTVRPSPTPTPSPPPTPTETATPAPTATPTPPPEAFVPILPQIDGAMKAGLRAIHQRGLELGMRPEVLAKIGDSITVSGFFLTELGCGGGDLGDYGDLAETVAFFRAIELPPTGGYARCGAHNSLTRVGPAARIGWSAVQVLVPFPATATPEMADGNLGSGSPGGGSPGVDAAQPVTTTVDAGGAGATGAVTATAVISGSGRAPPPTPPPDCLPPDDTPLRCEIKVIRPGAAIVMFGTNDLAAGVPPATFRANLDRIAGTLIESGVIPILSTIPPRTDRPRADARVSDYNVAIMAVAEARGLPLVNYWRALNGPEMLNRGMDRDGIHPGAVGYGAAFTPRGLRHGQNQRNLTLLQTLDKLRRIVYADGPAEEADPPEEAAPAEEVAPPEATASPEG